VAVAGTGKELGRKIAAKIIAPNADPQARQQIIALWEDIGDVIVDHFVIKTGLNVDAGIGVQVVPSSGTGATNAPGSGNIL
jgi:hypothetical protein